MFGFRGGESADTVARERGYIKDARREWRFLTRFDCSSIETKGQPRSTVGTRSGISEERAKRDVDAWTEGERFRAVPSISGPEQEGDT